MNLDKIYAKKLINEYADHDFSFVAAEAIDNKFSIWNYTFLGPFFSPAVIALVGTEKMIILSVSPRNLAVKKADTLTKADIKSIKAKSGLLTNRVKIVTHDNRKFDFELYKKVVGNEDWQKEAFERIQTLFAS